MSVSLIIMQRLLNCFYQKPKDFPDTGNTQQHQLIEGFDIITVTIFMFAVIVFCARGHRRLRPPQPQPPPIN